MHGYTHQYNSEPNRHNAVSADDFEFWHAGENRPVVEDYIGSTWAADRLSAGLAEMSSNGHPASVFEAPHYQASPSSYNAVTKRFANTYQRVVYYTSNDGANLNAAAGRDYSAGMFYPYIISSDYYGQRVMPENLGNVEYNICNVDPTSCLEYTWQDLHTNADYALVVRDGFASFFFHPFWIESDFAHLGAFQHFQNLVQGISSLGYQWVGMNDLIISVSSISPTAGPKAGGTGVTIKGLGFEPGAKVTIGADQAASVVVVNPTTITCVTPPSKTTGKKGVTVTNADGRSATKPGAFTYQ